jgi:hypothetical protein
MTTTRQKSIHGNHLYTTDGLLVTAGKGAMAAGGLSAPVVVIPGSPHRVTLFEDFLGDLIPDEWAVAENDTGATEAITAEVTNGVVQLTCATGDADTGSAVTLTSGLNWKMNQGGFIFNARVNISRITGISAFIGMTDISATGEVPFFEDTGTATQISNASNAFGFLFDTDNGHTTWQAVAVNANTDATPVDFTIAPVVNVFQHFSITGDASGNLQFFINGNLVGRIASAVATTVALTPICELNTHTTVAAQMNVDYVNVSALRDTGS